MCLDPHHGLLHICPGHNAILTLCHCQGKLLYSTRWPVASPPYAVAGWPATDLTLLSLWGECFLIPYFGWPAACQTLSPSDGSGSKNFDPGRVNFLWLGSGQPFMVWVCISKISPKKPQFFFPFGSKKIASSRVRKYPG